MVQRIRGRGAHRATVGLVVGKRGLHIISCRTENTICSTGNVFINCVGENMESNALIARGVFKSNNCPGYYMLGLSKTNIPLGCVERRKFYFMTPIHAEEFLKEVFYGTIY
jgi:hypothetical protein